jgi:hypothetical protein
LTLLNKNLFKSSADISIESNTTVKIVMPRQYAAGALVLNADDMVSAGKAALASSFATSYAMKIILN